MAFKQEINVPLIVTIGIVSVLVVMVLITGTEAWYKSEEQNEMAVKYNFPVAHEMRDRLKEKQKENIETLRWSDRNHKVVAIPIEDAMRIMVETNGKLPASRPEGR